MFMDKYLTFLLIIQSTKLLILDNLALILAFIKVMSKTSIISLKVILIAPVTYLGNLKIDF